MKKLVLALTALAAFTGSALAADILMVSRPRVSDVVNKKVSKFTIDALVEMLSRVGKPVKLTVD